MGTVSEEDHTMEILLPVMFAFIGAYVLYWVVRMGVRDGIADADKRRNESGPEPD
jgi:hypothetical protein